MDKIKREILMVFLLFSSLLLKAQVEVTFTDVRNFTLQGLDTGGMVDPAIRKVINLKATYIKNETVEKLDVLEIGGDTNKKFSVKYPLSRDEVKYEVIRIIGDTNHKNYSDYSLEQVFRWLYSLKQGDEGPKSGMLEIGSIAQILEGEAKNNEERMGRMSKWASQYSFLSTEVFKNLNGARKMINEAQKAFGYLNVHVTGTQSILNKVNNIKSYLSSNELPAVNLKTPNINILNALDEVFCSLKHLRAESPHSDSIKIVADLINEAKKMLSRYHDPRIQLIDLKQVLSKEKIFPIERISVQFERGSLERIQVWVYNEFGRIDIYENIYSIGFTGINNYRLFYLTRLFLRKPERLADKAIFLSDVLERYDNLLDLYTRDYSPADTVINEHQISAGALTLRRARYVNLFDSKVFTDLQGINPEEPNGLIQIELSRRFNINSLRRQVGAKRMDYAFFSHFHTSGGITKIEKKLRQLPIRNMGKMVNNTIVSPSYVTNLDLRRFENAFLNIDLNLFLFDWPDMKLMLFADIGARYAHIPMIDSLPRYDVSGNRVSATPVEFSAHTVSFSLPRISVEFFSERRVGFNLAFTRYSTRGFTGNRFKPIASYEKSNLEQRIIERSSRNSYMTELTFRVETNRDGNGQLFLRNRLFWQEGDANTYFMQTQLGYWYNIVFRK